MEDSLANSSNFWIELVQYFSSIDPVMAALIATTFTWLVTAAGAGMVFFFKSLNKWVLNMMLGFTGGVMIAASCFGLLGPAIDASAGEGFAKVMPATVGFLLGAMFLFVMDKLMPHLHINFKNPEGPKTTWHRTTLLVLAITLHNIPEGLAVGIVFGAAMGDLHMINSAMIIALGIGIQNFPEGFAVAMPLRREGVSRAKSFWYGQLSAIVEPIAGVIGAWAVTTFVPLLPYGLAFAAGAMIYVVVEEVIPETQRDKHSDIAVLGFMAGFVLMMALDVGLG
ncbi:MAG: ZIP family metal transporter [Flavobacteriales bacterium]|nr:ZIP family metal transporter [Flavobacteriales bacterium]MCB9197461.1 ZIP family metal transporter [Flavobacteriales bacterium]